MRPLSGPTRTCSTGGRVVRRQKTSQRAAICFWDGCLWSSMRNYTAEALALLRPAAFEHLLLENDLLCCSLRTLCANSDAEAAWKRRRRVLALPEVEILHLSIYCQR